MDFGANLARNSNVLLKFKRMSSPVGFNWGYSARPLETILVLNPVQGGALLRALCCWCYRELAAIPH